MSLINQMLKDLAQREKIPVDPEVTLSGLLSTDTPRTDTDQKKLKVIISLFCITTALFFMIEQPHKVTRHHAPPLTQTDGSIAFVNVQHAPAVFKAVDIPDYQPVKEPKVTLTGISLETEKDNTGLRFLLNQESTYRVSSNASQTELILTLPHTNLIADLPPVDYVKSAISGMQMTNDADGNLIITLSLHKGAVVNYLNVISGTKSPELQMNLIYHAPSDNPPAPIFSVKKTDEFNAKLRYQNAMNVANLGELDKAIQSLSDLTDEYPNYFTARESLVGILMQQGDILKARKVIEMGLQQKPYYPPLIEMKAHILVTEGKMIQALDLLERAPPPIEADPDYHAFIAALDREVGKATRAVKIYEQLVRLNPMKAQYWAGLGITLENSGKTTEAKEVYVHATEMAGLSPPLREYLETRIENLS